MLLINTLQKTGNIGIWLSLQWDMKDGMNQILLE